jgi:hypothetical protein
MKRDAVLKKKAHPSRCTGKDGRPCGDGARCSLRNGHANRLHFRVEFENFVAHLSAPTGLLVASEWECRVKDVVAVDPNGAST